MTSLRPKLSTNECEYVQWLRLHTSMSISRLAKKFDVSHVTIRKILDGSYRPAEDYKEAKKDD